MSKGRPRTSTTKRRRSPATSTSVAASTRNTRSRGSSSTSQPRALSQPSSTNPQSLVSTPQSSTSNPQLSQPNSRMSSLSVEEFLSLIRTEVSSQLTSQIPPQVPTSGTYYTSSVRLLSSCYIIVCHCISYEARNMFSPSFTCHIINELQAQSLIKKKKKGKLCYSFGK